MLASLYLVVYIFLYQHSQSPSHSRHPASRATLLRVTVAQPVRVDRALLLSLLNSAY